MDVLEERRKKKEKRKEKTCLLLPHSGYFSLVPGWKYSIEANHEEKEGHGSVPAG